MLRSRRAAIVLVTVAASRCAHTQPTTGEISSAELRAEIDRHSCAAWEPEVDQYSALFLDERCPYTSTAAPLARAVEAAVAEASPLTFLETSRDHFYAAVKDRPRPDQAAADALVRATFWRDPLLAPAIVDRALVHLPAHRLRCTDCVAPARPAARTASWSSFFPYLTAFVWPVQPEPGAEIAVYVCSATNGAAALPPDTSLIHAAKLAALAFMLDPASGAKVREIARGDVSRPLPEVAQALAALLDAPASRARICGELTRLRWFTGLTVDPC